MSAAPPQNATLPAALRFAMFNSANVRRTKRARIAGCRFAIARR